MYINETDINRFRFTLWKVEDDVKEIFKEALKYDKTLLIHAKTQDVYKKCFFKKYKTNQIKTSYTIYHENIGKHEARQMICASGSKEIVLAYLYGIINGNLHQKKANEIWNENNKHL